MRTVILAVAILIMMCTSSIAIEKKAIIISQKNIPVQITKYEAEYEEATQYVLGGIHHVVKYKNTGNKKIEAIQFGLVSFDVWNEYLDKTMGVSLEANDPGDSERGVWVTRAFGDFGFMTGLVYVSKIRYADGTIWKSDPDEVRVELTKIKKDFDMNELETKPEKK